MHFLAGHGVQIDQKPELIIGVELLQIHMLRFVFFFHEESAYFASNVSTFDAPSLYSMFGEQFIVTDFFLGWERCIFPNLLYLQCTAPQ